MHNTKRLDKLKDEKTTSFLIRYDSLGMMGSDTIEAKRNWATPY